MPFWTTQKTPGESRPMLLSANSADFGRFLLGTLWPAEAMSLSPTQGLLFCLAHKAAAKTQPAVGGVLPRIESKCIA